MAYPVSSERVKVARVVVSFHAHRALGEGCQREAQGGKENTEISSLCDGTHFSCLLFVLLPSPGHRLGTTPGNIRIFQKTSPCAPAMQRRQRSQREIAAQGVTSSPGILRCSAACCRAF